MDLEQMLAATADEQFDLFAETVNRQLVKVLRTIGFDRRYVRAQGSYLFDAEGIRFLDCLSGYGVFNAGRNHPRIKAALKEAIDRDLPSMVQMDAPLLAGRLAKKLLSLVAVDHIDTVFFTNSGTESVEAALKFARGGTRRRRVVHCVDAFHGLTHGALSANGIPEFRQNFEPLLSDFEAVPFGDLECLESALRRKDVAAFIVEPIQGKGVYTAPSDYFDAAVRLCRKYGTLVIADEVQCGMGRTGRWFACQYWNESPDMVCVAKALSGGFIPAGAVCYPRKIYNRVYNSMERCVVHSNTFGRNTLAMVAGLATIEVIEQENLLDRAAEIGRQLLDGLQERTRNYEMVKEIRGQGCMIGIEFGRPNSFKLKAGWDFLHKITKGLFGQLIVVPLMTQHHILSQVSGQNDIIKLLPPLTLTHDDVQWILNALEPTIRECHRFPGSAWDVGKKLAKQALAA